MLPNQSAPPQQQGASFNLADIYFLLFRHKWPIIICSVLGLTAAAALYLSKTRLYVSEAKILVRYIADRTSVNPTGGENVRQTDPQGTTILNSEIQIITSRDLAEDVARIVGPEKILAKLGGGTNQSGAADHILGNVRTDIAGKSSVIAIYYEHPDPSVAQFVLKLLVDRYMEKHIEIHRAVGAYEFLQAQTDRLRQQLMQTESDLHKLRTNSGVLSIDSAKESLEKQMAQLRETIIIQEAELEGRRALLPKTSATNGVAANSTNTVVSEPATPAEAGLYKNIAGTLDELRAREIEMLARFTSAHPSIIGVRSQIAELSKRKQEMEAANPQLALLGVTKPSGVANSAALPDQALEIPALEARLSVLKNQLGRLRAEAAQLDNTSGSIKDLERTKSVQEENYRAFSTSLEKARIDQAVSASKLTSISVVQAASVPGLSPGKRSKPVIMAAGGGVALGFLIAFISEFVLNPTVKRPADLGRGALRLMLAIPQLGGSRARRRFPFGRKAAAASEITHIDSLPAISDLAHPMRPYFEALRDRLLVEFEGNKQKPKLVGVTSCTHGAGASSIAAGIAAAISETGDGNVLLVDLNFETGSAHQFFKGKPVCALHDAVEEEKRGHGQVQDNLYLASINQANSDPTAAAMVPSKKIAEIMPKLKASDYDYIIFDMPPITPTSITFRMSGLMDKVLLVVESERTHRDVLGQASALLLQAKAKAETVLNRQQRHVPRFLAQELNGAAAN